MEENKKEYSIIGRVEIGTDEYRDLIEGIANLKEEVKEADNNRWKQYDRANKFEVELTKTKELLEKYQEFVNSSDELKEKMKSYFLQKKLNELEESDKE